MTKILVTGGAGYIGSHTIVEILETTDWQVVSADNYSNSDAKIFERIKNVTGKSIKNHDVNLCDAGAVKKMFEEDRGVDGIIHFAAYKAVPESVNEPLKYYHNNLESLLNLLASVQEYNIPYFIFSSSCSVYGNIDKLPVNENTPFDPISPYGFTKQIGERMVKDFIISYPHAKAVLLRYFNPVGAHISGKLGEMPLAKPSNLVPVITQTAIGRLKETYVHGTDYPTRDGTCIRDYVHVTDIAKAHVDALKYLMKDKNSPNCSVFNLGTGTGLSVMEMIKAFERVSGKKLNYVLGPRREGDVAAIYSDNTLVQKILGWQPKYSLDDMMHTAWVWEQNIRRQAD